MFRGGRGRQPEYPRHDNRIRLIPLCAKAACQAFLVRGVLSMEDGICGANQLVERFIQNQPRGKNNGRDIEGKKNKEE